MPTGISKGRKKHKHYTKDELTVLAARKSVPAQHGVSFSTLPVLGNKRALEPADHADSDIEGDAASLLLFAAHSDDHVAPPPVQGSTGDASIQCTQQPRPTLAEIDKDRADFLHRKNKSLQRTADRKDVKLQKLQAQVDAHEATIADLRKQLSKREADLRLSAILKLPSIQQKKQVLAV
jgi:hypothetical protein